jgi:FKBP-type peptidyl-prolyl cis-trans isomerase
VLHSHNAPIRLRRIAAVLAIPASAVLLAACGASDTTSSTGAGASACATAAACAVSSATDTGQGSSSSTTANAAGTCTNKATGQPDTFQNSVTLTTAADGLQTGDLVAGTGAAAASGQKLTVNYTGWLSTGTVFDSSCKSGGAPFPFTLGQGMVIKGWDEGLVGLKTGGMRRLVIPPALGYGSQGAGGAIPPNATLTFDVELISAA